MSDMWDEIPAGQVKEDELDKQLDEIVLTPAEWRWDLYVTAKQQLRSLILREKAKSFNEGYQKGKS